MLPSTGYFKGIICPFNESGLCERPYCHYRHLDFDESGAILQKLVSAAVLKALQQNDTSGAKPTAQHCHGDTATNPTTSAFTLSASKATYNPTPIAELNKINSTDAENLEDPNEQRKRHIPVPYTPRKSAGLPIKRPVDINDTKPFIYNPPGPPVKYKPGSAENVQNDTYTPTGTVESTEKYLPGTEKELQKYTPDANTQDSPSKLNYIPSSDKHVTRNKILEYKPAKVAAKTGKPVATYQPTPRALAPCFSSDEEEPEPKKPKLSTDLNGFDDLGPEFDILDQILDEEKPDENAKSYEKDKLSEKSKHLSKDCSKSNGDMSKSQKSNKSHHKSKSDKEKSDENHISKSEKKLSDEKRKKEDEKTSGDSPKSKSDKKSSENHRKKNSDETHKIKSEKKSIKSHETKSEKKPSDENHKSKSEKKSHENHKSKSSKSSSDGNHRSESEIKDKTNEKNKKENKHEYKKSSHKSSSKDTEKEKNDNKKKHSNDNKKHRSRSSDDSPKHSKHRSSEKHSESRSTSSSKSKHSKEKRRKKSKDKERHRSENKVLDSSDHETLDMEENGLEVEDYDLSDADEDAIALECKKIFEEYVPTKKSQSPDENPTIDNLADEYIPSKKRVSRSIDKNIKIIPRAPVKPDFKVNAANTMAERLSKVREFHSNRNIHSTAASPSLTNEIRDNTKIELQKPTFSAPCPVPSKIRIAHVPYASTMLNVKKTISPTTYSQAPEKLQASSSTTISQTVKKGALRVAHMPSEKFIDRPGVLEPLASKIPANIRSIYLNMMIDECLKLYISTHDAYARAQNEELTTSKKCSTVSIYKNSAVLAVSRLRKELLECKGVKKSADDCSNLKPDSSLKAMNSGSWSIENKNRKNYDNPQEFNGVKFYENIKKWILTEEELKENCFPRSHESGQKGRAIIYGQNKQNPPKGFLRTCCRCKKEYTVNKKGFPVIKEECIYHPNRKYRVRGEARYQCCTQDGTSDGCCVAPNHVYEYVDFENLKGYVTTLPPEPQVEDHGVYSLDCEMCYTTNGLDLTRVTVINSACKVVYETLVKPLHPIIDYNTRYSGITEEQMSHVKTTLLEVQATLLAMFSNKTILVGHSLESDFKALKLIHDTVIDTSVLFPHKMGPPFKRALRNLSTDYLRKIIQNSVEGHDSAEDAMVCMELLQYKLKEDLKTR